MYILAFCHALYEFKLVSQFLNITASVVLSCRETNAHPTPTVLFGQSLINFRMDTQVFIEWYDAVFIPEVKKHQIETGDTGNVLLVIDNSPSHPSNLSLEREDGKFKVIFLPPNVTSVVQPMDQGVIEAFQRYNRKALLRSGLIGQEEDKTILEIYKGINLKDAVYMAAEAWAYVKATTLKKSWNKLFPAVESEASLTSEEPTNENFVSEMIELMKEVS